MPKPRRKFQLSYADQGGQFHYFRPTSKARCLRSAEKLINKTTTAQILIRQDFRHLAGNHPQPS